MKGGTFPKKPDEKVVRVLNATKKALRTIRNEGNPWIWSCLFSFKKSKDEYQVKNTLFILVKKLGFICLLFIYLFVLSNSNAWEILNGHLETLQVIIDMKHSLLLWYIWTYSWMRGGSVHITDFCEYFFFPLSISKSPKLIESTLNQFDFTKHNAITSQCERLYTIVVVCILWQVFHEDSF